MMKTEKFTFVPGTGMDSAVLEGAFAASSVSTLFGDDKKYTVFPGFCDVHVHFREPGFCYKETMDTGRAAAAAGGFTAVCTMPNLDPVPDSVPHLEAELAAIRRGRGVAVYPYGALTVGEMGEVPSDMAGMKDSVVAFSDDGRGVQSESLMRERMAEAKRLGKIVAAHCEDRALAGRGYVHDGPWASVNNHVGIPSESEWGPIKRDLRLSKETGCAYHVCHVSCKESVALIRQAKKEGVNVTCETAPHYLILNCWNVRDHGRFKMNPPLRNESDRYALVEGILDGTVDMIATDHAPHSAEEKHKGLRDSAFGVVGLETAFPALYTHLVRTGILPLSSLVDLMANNPRRRFGIRDDGFSVWALDEAYVVDPEAFCSMGRATPFEGMKFYGVHYATVAGGDVIAHK